MEDKQISTTGSQASGCTPLGSEQGFALVSLLCLAPFAAALFIALCCSFYILKRKSLAQSHCVQQASQLQQELAGTLDQLLRLNPRAKILRTQRAAADRAVKVALASGNPYALAAAKAYWAAVVLQQIALRTQQQALLAQADRQRHFGHRRLRERLRTLRVASLDSRRYYWRALAVEARPPASLTPDYETLPFFQLLQQHRFRFQSDLRPPFAGVNTLNKDIALKQTTECSVTLKGKQKQWKVQIVAANAPSRWSWF